MKILPDPGYQTQPQTCIGRPGTRDIRYFHIKMLLHFHISIVNHFRNKILSAQRNVLIMQIFRQGTTKKVAFSNGFFFVRTKLHARVKPVFL